MKNSFTGTVLFTALCLSTQIKAQDHLTPELMWQLKRIGGMACSPDGKSAVYRSTSYDITKNKGRGTVYRIDVLSGNSTEVLSEDVNAFDIRWRPDGNKITYLSAKSGSVQLWEATVDGSAQTMVTDVEGGIEGYRYAPSMNRILYIKHVKEDTTVLERYPDLPEASAREYDDLMYRHWNDWREDSYSHVFFSSFTEGKVIKDGKDIMPGARYDAPLPPFGGTEELAWSRDGNSIVYTCKKMHGVKWAQSTNSDLYAYNIATDRTINLTEGMMGYDRDPQFSKDGSVLAWLSMKHDGFESDKNDIVIMDMRSQQKRNLTENTDLTVSSFTWNNKGDKMYFIAVTEATNQLFELNVRDATVRQVTHGRHNVTSLTVAGKYLIGTRQDMLVPNEVFKTEIATGRQTQLTFVNKTLLAPLAKPTIRKVMIKTTDDKDMLTWVILPPGFDSTKKYPALLYCQGGPQAAVSQFFSFRWNFHLMAAHGYIVVAPNRRGLPGFGQAWNDAISKDWGGQPMKDYLSAIDALAEKPYVDNGRLGCIGASYGGYSVYYLAGIHNHRFKCFLAHAGVFNLESWYASTEELFFADWDIGGPYWAKPAPASYAKFSPHLNADKWDTPIMIIHGQQDFRIPVTQGMQAFQVARINGVPSRFLYFPDECHWILQPQNGLLWHREFFRWLDQWLL